MWIVYGLIVSIALIILVNILGKTKFPKEIIISQASLDKIDDTLLLERNPIVISDSIVDCTQIIQSIFSYMYIAKKHVNITNNFEKNKFQYLVFWALQEDIDVVIKHPTLHEFVMIQLYIGNILILPWACKYQIKKGNTLIIIGLHSIMTFTLGLV